MSERTERHVRTSNDGLVGEGHEGMPEAGTA